MKPAIAIVMVSGALFFLYGCSENLPFNILATWDDGAITAEDLDRRLLDLSSQERSEAEQNRLEWYRGHLESIFAAKVLLTTQRLTQLQQDERFIAGFRGRRHATLVSAFLRAHPQDKPSNEQLRDYFTANRDQFDKPEQRALSNLLVPTDTDGTCSTALQLRQRIIGGESFSLLAKRYSHSSTATNGGMIGAVRAKDLRKEVADFVFALGTGELSRVQKGPNGCQFFLVGQIQPAFKAHFATSHSKLLQHYNAAHYEAWRDSLLQLAAQQLDTKAPDVDALLDGATPSRKVLYQINNESITTADLRGAVARGIEVKAALQQLVAEVMFAAAILKQQPAETAQLLNTENNAWALEYLRQTQVRAAVDQLSDAELKNYYQQHQGRFKRDPQLEIELISWPLTSGDPIPQTARANLLLETLATKGSEMSAVWDEFATDPGIERSILPLTTLRSLHTSYRDLNRVLLSDLQNEPFQGPYVRGGRIEVLVVKNYIPGRTPAYAEIREQVKAAYISNNINRLTAERMQRLQDKHGFQIIPNRLENLGAILQQQMGLTDQP